jgi:GTP-binding protein
MLLHLIALDVEDPVSDYYTIRKELSEFSDSLTSKEEWIVLSKKDLVKQEDIEKVKKELAKTENRVFVIGQNDPDSYKELQDTLVSHVRATYNSD